MRTVRSFLNKWRLLILACAATYAFIFYLPNIKEMGQRKSDKAKLVELSIRDGIETPEEKATEERNEVIRLKFQGNLPKDGTITKNLKKPVKPVEDKGDVEANATVKSYKFSPVDKESFYVEAIMTADKISLDQKFDCKAKKEDPPKIILSWNAGHGQEHLSGCPDWNCILSHDRSRVNEADAVMLMHPDPNYVRRGPDQYVVYFSQESPVNSGFDVATPDYFNLTLGFRRDTAASSPYGYTVKLAPESRKTGKMIDENRVKGKSAGAAWFVSHCTTNSRREDLVNEMKKDIDIDIYGACGDKKCPRGGDCESDLDTKYHFYIAFENSICKDYITEKLWNQGYKRDVVPVILKRSLAEPFIPPKSFIAADDYKTTQEMTAHMKYLMQNHTAYMEYFDWRRDYHVVFLDGAHHDVLERPWGFCQVCRLLWDVPRQTHIIEDFTQYWRPTCEQDGDLVRPLIQRSQAARSAAG